MARPFKQKSVKKHQPVKFKGEVRDLASDGRGVVRHDDGRTYFVPGVWQGEKGEFRSVSGKGNIGEAVLVALEETSSERIEPICEHLLQGCGGCPWMFVNYKAQLDAKFKRVIQAMTRLGLEEKVRPVIGSDKSLGYRNRAQFKTDGEVIGYMAARTNALVPIESCAVLTQKNNDTLQSLRALLPNPAWRPKSRQKWISLDVDETVCAEEVSINQRLPFQQGNSAQNNRMRQWLAEKLSSVVDKSAVMELFCGAGNFTEVISEAGFEKTYAAEISESAIQELDEKNLSGVKPCVVDLFDEQAFAEFIYKARESTTLVLDPPRDGLKVREGLFTKKSKLQNVFYISCDLATFARDTADFQKAGFTVEEIQPIDLFPQTPHVELMGFFHKNG